jgi:hypothetical protein
MLMFIISITSLYYIFITIVSIYSRDNMVYDEYNWNFNKNSAPKMGTDASFKNAFELPSMMSCIGEKCCQEGTLWNKDIGKCVAPEVSTTNYKQLFSQWSPGGVGSP